MKKKIISLALAVALTTPLIDASAFTVNAAQVEVASEAFIDDTTDLVEAGYVAINSTNFPDANFRKYLLTIDYDGDKKLAVSDVKRISATRYNIKSLKGIELFTSLTSLDVDTNFISSINLTKNVNLEYLDLTNNSVSSIDLSKNTKLKNVYLGDNRLTSLDVSACANLVDLFASRNKITSVNIGSKKYLKGVYLASNYLTKVDVTACPALEVLIVEGNRLASLNVTKNVALTKLYCNNNSIKSLNVTKNTALSSLSCSENNITNLNLAYNKKLTYFSGYQYIPVTKYFTNTTGKFDFSKVSGFTASKVSGVTGAKFSNNIFTLNDFGNNYGYFIYSYDCGNAKTMSVRILGVGKDAGTLAKAPIMDSVTNTKDGVKVNWKVYVSDITKYNKFRVFRKEAGGKWTAIGDCIGSTFTDKYAVSGKTYYYTARGINADGTKYVSDYDKTGLKKKYVAAPSLMAPISTSTGVKLSWNSCAGAGKYRIYRKKAGDSSWTKVADTTSTSYVDKIKKSSTSYYYTVKCISSDGKKSLSGYDEFGRSVYH